MASFNRNTEEWCPCCNKAKSFGSFVVSLNPSHKKYIPYCKTCINAKFKEYNSKLNNEGASLWLLCAELGYPFISEAYKILLGQIKDEKSTAKNNVFYAYHQILKDLGFIVEGFWQSDTMLNELMDLELASQKEEVLNYNEMESKWGKFDVEDYDLLEKFYNMYTQDIPNLSVPEQLRYQDLCKAELRKRKADESGDIAEITKAQDNIRKIMEMLKLNDFKSNQVSDIEKFIERKCWEVENTKPCECEDLEKYKDFSNFNINWSEMMRCLKNLVTGSREYPDIDKGGDK